MLEGTAADPWGAGSGSDDPRNDLESVRRDDRKAPRLSLSQDGGRHRVCGVPLGRRGAGEDLRLDEAIYAGVLRSGISRAKPSPARLETTAPRARPATKAA